MASNDSRLTGEYLDVEYRGAQKATGIGQREWVRKTYPDMTYGQWWGRVYRARLQAAGSQVEIQPDLFQSSMEPELELDGDWMVVGDVHVPCTDYDFA